MPRKATGLPSRPEDSLYEIGLAKLRVEGTRKEDSATGEEFTRVDARAEAWRKPGRKIEPEIIPRPAEAFDSGRTLPACRR
jgi:hypothetical protein